MKRGTSLKNNLTLSFILVFLILINGCTPQTTEGSNLPRKIAKPLSEPKTATSNFLTYENYDYGFKIGYPSDWQQAETEDVIAAFMSPKTDASESVQENLGLTMNDLAGRGLTLSGYNEIAIEQLKQAFPDIKIVESGSTMLSDNPAHKVVFTASNLKFMQAWTMKNDLVYVWSYVATESSYSNYLGTIQEMLDSFEITRNIRGEPEEKPAEKPNIEKTAAQDIKTLAQDSASVADADSAFLGGWRIFSERIFYDVGGAGSAAVPVSRKLELLKDGTWEFGDSQGTWTVTEITSEDWTNWGINSYGPTRKIVLDKWNKATADGPIEEEKGQIDFIWVIYHVEPPLVQNAGKVWLKFGHS